MRALGFAVALVLAALATTGCRSRGDAPRDVRLTSGPVTAVGETGKADHAEQQAVRFVLTSILSPDRTTLPQARFATHLAARLDRPVSILRRRTYSELNDLLRNGHADAGIVCAGAYAVAHAEFGLRIVAGTVVDGQTTYRAYVIARRAARKRSLDDLRGSVFAFSDPLSNSGYRHVAAVLHGRGTTPSGFFGKTFFTFSHDNTVQALRDGIADGGVVDSFVWDELLREDSRLADEVEVIERSPPFPNSPVVVSPRAHADLEPRLRRALLAMSDDVEGRAILRDLGISGFVEVAESAYEPIVASWRELGVIRAAQPGPTP
jgi:phosphonate transport system substrate-binding protein